MVLVIVGIIFIFGIYPLSIVWPAGWIGHASGRSMYLEMILWVYAAPGVFLLLASSRP